MNNKIDIKFNHLKEVEYFGNKFTIAKDIKYIAIDEDGCVCGFSFKPTISADEWMYDIGICADVGDANLNGFDWMETLREV